MGPDNIFVKILIVLILVGVVAHFGLGYKNEQNRQVKATTDAITAIAATVADGGTADVDSVTAAIAPLHEVSYGNLIEGVRRAGSSVGEYVGAEVILLRIYELGPTDNIKTRIKIEGAGNNWPWVFDGDKVTLEPFKIDSGTELGTINDLITMYEEQGELRKPWRN